MYDIVHMFVYFGWVLVPPTTITFKHPYVFTFYIHVIALSIYPPQVFLIPQHGQIMYHSDSVGHYNN